MDQLVIDVPAREHPQNAGRGVLVQTAAGTASLEQGVDPFTLHVTSDRLERLLRLAQFGRESRRLHQQAEFGALAFVDRARDMGRQRDPPDRIRHTNQPLLCHLEAWTEDCVMHQRVQ
jgi:hypothetical protein